MVSPLDPFLARTRIAYFSMEIATRPEMHTYSGGLGILAGDTARSCADLELPLVFVTLVCRAGCFRQRIDAEGRQVEEPDPWQPAAWCTPLDAMVSISIEGSPDWIRPWLYVHTCPHSHQIPILLLDTDLDQNAAADRELTHYLYGGDVDDVSDEHHGAVLYDKLDRVVLPLYSDDPARWQWMMKQAIGNIAYYFNSQRMMRRYATEAYLR